MALGMSNFKQKVRIATKQGFQKSMGQDGKPKRTTSRTKNEERRDYEDYPSAKYCK